MFGVLLYNAKRIGLSSTDGSDERVLKKNLTTIVFSLCFLSTVWALMYVSMKLYVSGLIAFSFAIVASIALALFSRSKKRVHLIGIVLPALFCLPFFVQISLGGLQNSGLICLWSILCPIGSLLFQNVKCSIYWLIAFVASTVIIIYLDENIYNSFPKDIPTTTQKLFMAMNIVCVTSVTFFAVLH